MAQDASGDAEAGEADFRQCRTCHSITDAEGNDIVKGGKVGPNLYGVVGRQAGSWDDFAYSDFMVAAGEAGLSWNVEDFTAYESSTLVGLPAPIIDYDIDNPHAVSYLGQQAT